MTDIAVQEDRDIRSPAEKMLAAARDLVIDSPQMLQIAADELGEIKARIKALNEERLSLTRPLDESKSRIIAKYKPPLDMLGQAADYVENSVRRYNEAERRKAEDVRRAAEEAARKERQRLEDEARRERERAAAAEAELRRKAEEAAAAGRAAEAAKLNARADAKVDAAESRAESLEQVASTIPEHAVVAAPPKAAGLSSATLYSAAVTDLAELVKFVAVNPMYLGLLQINQTALNAQAKALKRAFALPGCRLIETESLRSRAA